jgi:hypothetical protein
VIEAALKLLAASDAHITPLVYVGGFVQANVGSNGTATVSLTSLTGGIASAPAEGDVVFVAYSIGTTVDRTGEIGVTGYKKLTALYADDAIDSTLGVFWKRMTSTPDTSITISGSSGTDARATAIQVWRGCSSWNPVGAYATATGLNTRRADPPSITPQTNKSVILACGSSGVSDTSANSIYTASELSGFQAIWSNDTNDSTVGLGYKTWTSGAFDPAAFSTVADSINNGYCAVTLAVEPENTAIARPTLINTASQQNSATGATLVINKPSGTLEGHLLIAFAVNDDSAGNSWTAPSGWIEVADQGNAPDLFVAYKIAGDSEPADYTFTCSISTRKLSGSILTYANAAYDTIGSIATATDPLIITSIASIAKPYSILIGFASRINAALTITPPAEMTTLVTDNGTDGPSYCIAHQQVNYGQSGTRAFSGVSGTTNSAGVLVALKPA